MLRTRILTAAILACLLLAGLFLLPAPLTVLGFGAVFTVGAWEWGAFGLRGVPARIGYAALTAVLLFLAWKWTAEPAHLTLLLGAACVWWGIAFLWLSLAPTRHLPGLVLVCGLAVLVPAFVALARLQIATRGFAHGPQIVLWLLLLVMASDIGAYFAGHRLGRL